MSGMAWPHSFLLFFWSIVIAASTTLYELAPGRQEGSQGLQNRVKNECYLTNALQDHGKAGLMLLVACGIVRCFSSGA